MFTDAERLFLQRKVSADLLTYLTHQANGLKMKPSELAHIEFLDALDRKLRSPEARLAA